jgi:hypothetical protein
MTIKITNIILLTSFLFACSTNKGGIIKRVNYFPINGELNCATTIIPVSILQPTRIFTYEDKLVIFDDVKNEIFKVFKLPEIDYLYGLGDIGRGPNEFLFIDGNYIRVINKEIELLDNGKLKRIQIANDSLITKTANSVIVLDNPLNNLQRINDSIYISDNIFSDNEYEHLMINLRTNKVIKKFGEYPDKQGLMIKTNVEGYQVFKKVNNSSPSGDYFVAFYEYFNRFKIYNNNGSLQKDVFLDDEKEPTVSVSNMGNSPIYFFSQPCVTVDYIYVLRLSKSEVDLQKDFGSFKPELLIFNWNGDAIAKYKLNKPITSIAISEEGKKLYGVNIMKENEIYTFNLY